MSHIEERKSGVLRRVRYCIERYIEELQSSMVFPAERSREKYGEAVQRSPKSTVMRVLYRGFAKQIMERVVRGVG